jgi:hypothetical protein
MNKRLWFARAVLVYGVLIFTFLAYLYLVEPLKHIERFGLVLAVTSLYGLLRPQMLRASLIILVVFNACVVGARLFGIAHDGVTPLQLTELRDEGSSWLLFVVALLALRGMPLRTRLSGSGGWN